MKTYFFDLFWTLISPLFNDKTETEYSVLGISKDMWNSTIETDELIYERNIGKVNTPEGIILEAFKNLPFTPSEEQLERVTEARIQRVYDALTIINPEILQTLSELKKRGAKLCLVSNADVIDKFWWNKSPLCSFFDQVIFSCDIGTVKPEPEIYRKALSIMNAEPENSIFIGDGGSDELKGARNAGMKTVLTEFLIVKDEKRREEARKYADYVISDFKKLLEIN